MVFQVNLPIGKCFLGSRILENIAGAFYILFLKSVNVLTTFDMTIRHPQLVVTTYIGIVSTGQWNMICSTRLVRMDNNHVTHRNLLYGIQYNMLLFFVNTHQLITVDGKQGRSVFVYLTLRLVGHEIIMLGELDNLTYLACHG